MPPENVEALPIPEIYRRIDRINDQVNQLARQARTPGQARAVQQFLAEILPLREELRRREAVRAQALAGYSAQELKLLMDALLDDRLHLLAELSPGQPMQEALFDRFWCLEHEINALTRVFQEKLRPR